MLRVLFGVDHQFVIMAPFQDGGLGNNQRRIGPEVILDHPFEMPRHGGIFRQQHHIYFTAAGKLDGSAHADKSGDFRQLAAFPICLRAG
ncbi:hypothetical protein SDC9_205154 [bioreactor metagenome]|uniref:Uncharacterized protein n=1 Tax=bioreactor metagenome TaxID=1076179 RepID=A0A645J2R4_9ZZZZ